LEKLLRIEEVAGDVGCSVYTLNLWYKFKKEEPDSYLAKLLPDYIQSNATSPRYWKKKDIKKLLKFKETRRLGRYGEMGKVTQKYYKKGKNNEE